MNQIEREELERFLDQLPDPFSVSTVRVGQTYALSAYPTTAGAWYAMADVAIGGDETEGSAASFIAYGENFRAFNLGTSIPTVGSKHLCFAIEGRYVFRA